MKTKDLFGDDVVEKKNLAELDAYLAQKIKVGSRVQATILSIAGDTVVVDVGAPIDGILPKKEIMDADGQLKYAVGDKVPCVVKRASDEEILLKLDGAQIRMNEAADLEDAFDRETPVEGLVVEMVKGGFRVMLPGQVRAFCPQSQMDWREGDSNFYLNKKFSFVITQWEQNGKNVVVSRKKALEQERLEQERAFLQQVQAQDLLTAQVVRIEKFGAFIWLPQWNLEGLIPVSEIAWVRVRSIEEVIKVGDQVEVMFIGAKEDDTGKLRLSFSLKQAQAHLNPWDEAHQKYPVGSTWEGEVEKKEPYGYFIRIAPGVVGLLPKSAYRDLIEHRDYEQLKRGDKIKVRILQIDVPEKKIALGVVLEEGENDGAVMLAESAKGKLGTLGDLLQKTQTKRN